MPDKYVRDACEPNWPGVCSLDIERIQSGADCGHGDNIGLALVGFFLLLAALGQLSGINILGETATLLGTTVGRWLLVALVAIALITIALYGFTNRSD